MDTELTEQAVGAEAAAAEAASAETTSTGQATTGTEGAPDIQAQINEAVQAAIKEYEGAGGHLAKLKSKYDTKVAELERKLREQHKSKTDEAMALMDSDPAKAAQILADIVQAQAQEAHQSTAEQELTAWQRKIMEDLDFDLDKDEEAAEMAAQWSKRLLQDPNLTWDFQQEVARKAKEREKAARTQAEKERDELRANLPDLIKAEVTRALVGAGLVPDASEGSTPAQRDQDWRERPDGQLLSEGLAERKARPIKRT